MFEVFFTPGPLFSLQFSLHFSLGMIGLHFSYNLPSAFYLIICTKVDNLYYHLSLCYFFDTNEYINLVFLVFSTKMFFVSV